MKYLKQLATIFLVCAVGQLLAACIGNVVPGNVLAMILLFLCLIFKVIKIEQVEETSDFLLANMAFLFLPVTVSVFFKFDVFEGIIIRFFVVCVITMILTSLCAGYTVKLIVKLQNKKKGGNQ